MRALRRSPGASVISPWDRGTVDALRPGPRKALIIVDYHHPLSTAMRETVPELDRILEQNVHPPLRATQSGFATVSRALQEETVNATERAELLAVPLLLIVLLLVFRSVVAAAIPLAFGALTVVAGRGVLVLLSSVMTIDAISLVVCTMMGLALGVDYSLLIVSRFREELGRRPRPPRGREAQPGDRRQDDRLRRGDPARGARALGLRPTRLAAALAGGHGRGGDGPQRRRRGRRPARVC